jgi:hypothetical protein
MADSPAPYRKLPGRGSGVISIATLWEGDSHLLLVTSCPSGESYRRFFYADIQAMILRRTSRWKITNIILGLVLLAAAAPFLATLQRPGETAVLVVAGIVAGLCAFFLLLNTLLGPTCTLYIQTPIRCEQLPIVRRERQARRVLARLQPLVTAAQPLPGAGV